MSAALKLITAGESHGPGLTAIVEGLPAGLELDQESIDGDMARRQLGHGRGGAGEKRGRAAPAAAAGGGERSSATARRPGPASATGARSAARSPCRSRTATSPTGRSG